LEESREQEALPQVVVVLEAAIQVDKVMTVVVSQEYL
jgi:hypothetical protein